VQQAIQRPPPKQPRAEAKRSHILRVTEELLDGMPPSEITTRLIAQSAEIPIGSVYRYFANVEAVLHELFERFNADTLEAMTAIRGREKPWREHLHDTVEVIRDMHQRHPAYGAVMNFVRRDGTHDDRPMMLALAKALSEAGPHLSEAQTRNIAATANLIMEAVESRYHTLEGEKARLAFDEGVIALEAYLERYLDI
jgi:AcrR family transcriptional regulator